MEYITKEQFKEQSEEIQTAFIKWWYVDETDLVFDGYNFRTEPFKTVDSIMNRIGCQSKEDFKKKYFTDNKVQFLVPLLTESQLRSFIEDKTKGKIELTNKNYNVELIVRNEDSRIIHHFCGLERVLIAYWKIACEVITN